MEIKKEGLGLKNPAQGQERRTGIRYTRKINENDTFTPLRTLIYIFKYTALFTLWCI